MTRMKEMLLATALMILLSSEMVERVAQPTCVLYLHGKTQEVMVWFTPVEMIARL